MPGVFAGNGSNPQFYEISLGALDLKPHIDVAARGHAKLQIILGLPCCRAIIGLASGKPLWLRSLADDPI